MKEIILNQNIEKELERVLQITAKSDSPREDFSVSPRTNLYTVTLTKLAKDTHHNETQAKYLDIFDYALAAFKASTKAIRQELGVYTLEQKLSAFRENLDDREDIRNTIVKRSPEAAREFANQETELEKLTAEVVDKNFFANRYSLFFAGQIGLAMLDLDKGETDNRYTFSKELDASSDSDRLVNLLTKSATHDLVRNLQKKKSGGEELNDEDLKHTLQYIFATWIEQFNYQAFKDVVQENNIDDLKLKLDNYSVKAGEFSKKHDIVIVEGDFIKTTMEDYVGPKGEGSAQDIIHQQLLKLSCYDTDLKKNPRKPHNSILLIGDPGVGKSFTISGVVHSHAQNCRDYGIPFKAITLSTTDFATEYQNQSANRLKAIANELRDFPGHCVMTVFDADMLYRNRGEKLTPDQAQVQNVFFKLFDGSIIPQNGKVLFIQDTNYVHTIDKATRSRIMGEVVQVKRFDQPEYFADLMKIMIQGKEEPWISDADFLEVGEEILAGPLSNRELSHVTRGLLSGERMSSEMMGSSYDQHKASSREYLTTITKERILDAVREYTEKQMIVERESREKLFEQSLDMAMDQLNEVYSPEEGGQAK